MKTEGLPTIRVGTLDVACQVEGPQGAPALLLIHGVLADHRAWDGVAERLKDRFRIVRYDVRGHGGSSAPPAPYTLEQLADDVPPLLDALGLDQVHLAGTSMGGMIGQQVGIRHGDRLLSLTLANNAAQQAAPAVWDQRIEIARRDGIEALVEPTVQRWFTAGFLQQHGDEVERIRDLVRGTSVEGYAGCATAIRNMAQLDQLGAIRVPTLVIVGSEDQATPPAAGQQIADAIPGAQLVALPAAHQAAVEVPQAFCDAWLAFIARL
jgi:3-oxoadipate enol-lactonase